MVFLIFYWANYTQTKTKLSRNSENRPGFEVFVWRRLTSCWILSAMSPEIQEWSHKSRSRINNLYLLTHPILLLKECYEHEGCSVLPHNEWVSSWFPFLIWYKLVFGLITMQYEIFQRNSSSTRGHGCKLYKIHCENDTVAAFFCNRVINVWNSLSPSVVDFSPLNKFTAPLAYNHNQSILL